MGDVAVPLPEWVRVVLAAAPLLRAAGVVSIGGVDGHSASFLPPDPAPPRGEIDKADASVEDEPLEDMWSGTRGFDPEPR